jgi:CRP-like cAMP-binding protein
VDKNSSQIRNTKRARQEPAGRWIADATHRGTGFRAKTKGDVTMQPEARSRRMDAVAAHPLAELLQCPPATGSLLNGSAQCIDFDAGEIVFRQSGVCRGLYVVVSGQFLRRAERLETRLTLGPARAGDLVELAAALGDGHHTYTLVAQTPGSVLLLPIEALSQAFENHPPLRMQLLEELAREVSRAYNACCLNRSGKTRRRTSAEC